MLAQKYSLKKFKIQYNKITSYFVFLTLLSLNLLIVPSNSDAITAEVIITLDQHEIEFMYEPNSSLSILIPGNVTCEVDGWGGEVQRIEVFLQVDSELNWAICVVPSYVTFESNGRKRINLSIEVPDDVHNRTINRISVHGGWETKPIGNPPMGDAGNIPPDRVVITINRTTPLIFPGDSPEFYDESEDLIEALGGSFIIIVLSILILIIISIIVFAYYRKRKNNKLLLDYQEKEK